MPAGTLIDTSAATESTEAVFKLGLTGVAYADVPSARSQLLDFLEKHNAAKEYAGRLTLTVTEIHTNLAKHPPQKATRIDIRLRLTPRNAYIDVSDNSTPFAEFDAKCKSALARLNAGASLEEGGYGLGVILKQHAQASYTPMTHSPDGLNHFRVIDHSTAPASRHKNTVFLVDDDPVAMKRHCTILEGMYNLMPFGRAEEALKAFPAARPDIVVSDLNMPGMDGLGLRRALSELEGGDATPFIFLSGETLHQNNPYISDLGVDDFLCKPVDKNRLQSVVARLISRSLQVRRALEGKFQQHLTSMLRPALPETYGGWRIVTLTEAAEAGGGDFTLHHETPARMLAVLADVMGHGPQAKFFSYAYAGYLRSLFRLQSTSPDPAHFLAALAASIDGDEFLESIIITCQSFLLSPKGQISIASAGHPAPMLVRRSGAETIDSAGPLPALASMAGYNLSTLALEDGEKIIFATDGFLQAFDAEGFKRGTLLKLLDGMARMKAQDMAALLWQAYAAKNIPASQRDDATLIIAEYGGH